MIDEIESEVWNYKGFTKAENGRRLFVVHRYPLHSKEQAIKEVRVPDGYVVIRGLNWDNGETVRGWITRRPLGVTR